MVEDLPADAELIKRQIRKSGIQFTDLVVDRRENYVTALQDFNPDIILSDYSLPLFSGMEALIIKENLAPSVPFILVTGSINEETAVEVMKAGADDYIIKDHITRLGTAIGQAIEKKAILKSKKAAEDQLRILSRAIEQNPASIVITNTKGDIEYVNPKFSELTGYSFDEVFGQNPRVLKSGTKSSEEYRQLWETITNGGEWHGEFENIKKNREIYYESAVISPIADENGKITHYLAVKEDITEIKKADRKIRLLAHSMESISECVTITDMNDEILYVNESFLRTYGFVEDELIGQKIDIIRPDDLQNLLARNILPKVGDESWRGEIMNKRKDGSLFPIMLSSTTIKDENGKVIALIGVGTDITLAIRNREELMEAKARSEETSRLRSALLNNLSHEVRTPMNAIMGFSSLMADADSKEKDSFASIILKSSGQLLALIDEVILLSRLQSEKMTVSYTGVSPAEAVRYIFSVFSIMDRKKGVELKMNIPEKHKNLIVVSDTNKIRQILTNLTSNAIKYTMEGSIELGYDQIGDEVEFYVKDTGLGISSEEQQKVFETFYRSEQAISMAIGGTGLGLSITKELVGLIGGNLSLTSEPNKGSRFYFSIPCKYFRQENAPVPVQAAAPKDIKDFKILIVDDEEVNIQYLCALLKNNVLNIEQAFNGKDAVELALKNSYNLILMDIKMPVMGGIEATRILKEKYPDLRIIAQTAFTLPEETAAILDAGCDDILCKPIRKDQLMEMIQKYG